MENLTTPFKASVIALVSHLLVSKLNMGDIEAGSIGTAVWLLLMGGLNFVVPKEFGSSISAKMLAMVLKMRRS